MPIRALIPAVDIHQMVRSALIFISSSDVQRSGSAFLAESQGGPPITEYAYNRHNSDSGMPSILVNMFTRINTCPRAARERYMRVHL